MVHVLIAGKAGVHYTLAELNGVVHVNPRVTIKCEKKHQYPILLMDQNIFAVYLRYRNVLSTIHNFI